MNPDTLHMYVGYTDTLHVQWQFASSLSKSQSVISRTNSNSNLYYTLAYLGEPGEPAKESGAGAGPGPGPGTGPGPGREREGELE